MSGIVNDIPSLNVSRGLGKLIESEGVASRKKTKVKKERIILITFCFVIILSMNYSIVNGRNSEN